MTEPQSGLDLLSDFFFAFTYCRRTYDTALMVPLLDLFGLIFLLFHRDINELNKKSNNALYGHLDICDIQVRGRTLSSSDDIDTHLSVVDYM